MPDYDHECTLCHHEWEDTYSINTTPPTTCPNCGQEGAKRVISLTGRGVVELSGADYKQKIFSDAKALERKAASSEKVYSNLVGHDKYESIQRGIDKRKRGN